MHRLRHAAAVRDYERGHPDQHRARCDEEQPEGHARSLLAPQVAEARPLR